MNDGMNNQPGITQTQPSTPLNAAILRLVVAIVGATGVLVGGYYGVDALQGTATASPPGLYALAQDVVRLETKIDYISEDIAELKVAIRSISKCE